MSRRKTPSYFLVDAQAMAAAHPTTFQVPSDRDLSNIEIGDYVMVCVDDLMRVCLEVIDLDRQKPLNTRKFYALVYDNPFLTGLQLWDHVEFEARHVYGVTPRQEALEARKSRGVK